MLKGNYRFKRLFDEKIAQLKKPARQSLVDNDAMLSFDTLKNYQKLNLPNSKLRHLITDYIDKQKAWQLLWMPPSLPYYQLSGGYEGQEKLTKRLIFSAWRIVPRTLAMLMSYEVERRIHDRYTDTRRDYQNPPDGNLISFTIEKKDDSLDVSLTSLNSMTLMYPSITLAKKCDPLKLPLGLTAEEAIEHTEAIIRPLVDDLRQHYPTDSSKTSDSKWYSLAPVLLDRIYYPDATKRWFGKNNPASRWTYEETNAKGWGQYVNYLKKFSLAESPPILGTMPNDLVSVLAKIALGSPAICGLRAITRLTRSFDTLEILRSAVHIAWQMRLLYNRPFPTNLIRGQYDSDYWRAVLQYGVDGNLQAMLDEYTHVLRDSLGLFDANDDIMAKEISIKVGHALSMGSISLNMEEYDKTILTKVDKSHGIRTHFAMSLLEDGSDNDDNKQNKKTGQSHQANLRDSFNSPFWPHVLISTSIGQEGLDFHQHCHAIVHWNLPHNPVDLEQREGRIHRYKGHAIRRNIARCYGQKTREFFRNNKVADIWEAMFTSAECDLQEQSDLMPFWIMPVDDLKNYTYIERHVPLIPLSRDNQKFTKLRKMVGYYRMVFGQVRQEDMMDMLMDHSDALNGISMKDLQIDLSPTETHNKYTAQI